MKDKPNFRPAGVTGIFLLEAVPATRSSTPLDGPWFAAGDVGVLAPVKKGEKVKYTYLETKFTLPKEWPAKRVFLESPVKLQWLVINGQVIQAPIHSLDVSGLVNKEGENILRWIPDFPGVPDMNTFQDRAVPDLKLAWKE